MKLEGFILFMHNLTCICFGTNYVHSNKTSPEFMAKSPRSGSIFISHYRKGAHYDLCDMSHELNGKDGCE